MQYPTRWLILISAAVAAVLTVPGTHGLAASTGLRPGIIGDDGRAPMDNSRAPWTAIGHVNVSGYRNTEKCTGTRIGPRLVLTAAHCVVNLLKRMPVPAKDVHFVAGVNKDASVGHSIAACIVFPDDFAIDADTRMLPDIHEVRLSMTFLQRDIAVIVLKDDISKAGAIPTAQTTLAKGSALLHASYPADKRMMLMAQTSCGVAGKSGDLIATDCDAVAGSSGGPMLVKEDGELRVAGVMAASTQSNVNLMVPVTVWPNLPREAKCPLQ
jgi:protease YdgD